MAVVADAIDRSCRCMKHRQRSLETCIDTRPIGSDIEVNASRRFNITENPARSDVFHVEEISDLGEIVKKLSVVCLTNV